METLVPTTPVVADVCDDLQLVARSPEDMQTAQRSLIIWVDQKISILNKDFDEASHNATLARKAGIKPDTFDRQCNIARRRVEYYEKIKAALDAGYCIVPNFPVDVFAIRTNRTTPKQGQSESRYAQFEQHPMKLPAGAGEYRDNLPVIDSHFVTRSKPSGEKYQQEVFYPTRWPDEIDFPVSVVKPIVMSATVQAMALKCFDSLGIAGGRHVKGDPIVVGHIYDPRSNYLDRFVTFLIAWWVDTKDL